MPSLLEEEQQLEQEQELELEQQLEQEQELELEQQLEQEQELEPEQQLEQEQDDELPLTDVDEVDDEFYRRANELHQKVGIPLEEVIDNYSTIQEYNIRNYTELKTVLSLYKEALDNDWSLYIQEVLEALRNGCDNHSQLQIIARLGKLEKVEQEKMELYGKVIIRLPYNVARHVMPDYLNMEYYTITCKELVTSGVPLQELFPGVDKRDRHMLYLHFEDEYFRWVETGTNIAPEVNKALQLGLPAYFLQHIKQKKISEIVTIMKWAKAHESKLTKSRTIYGPAGQTATLHYWTLLEKISPEMLTNGVKTSFDKVVGKIEEEARKELEASLGVNVDLPKFPNKKPLPKGVKQLTTSFALKDEGELMDNCVFNYTQACLKEISYIFHAGSPAPDGATVEVCPNPWRVQQVFAKSNEEAPAELLVLAEEIIETVV